MGDTGLASIISAAQPRYAEMVRRDVTATISHFRDLHPSTEHYVFNDGRQSLVITLNGTIPINYKGNVYNIPICLYLMETHPYNPPICYVRPTSDMMIKPNANVDTTGRVYLPYLHQWKYPQSDLNGLIQIMSIVFSESCPVFSKSSSATNLSSSANPSYPGSAPYPLSNSYGYMPSLPSQSGGSTTTSTAYQPYPGVTGGQRASWYSSPYTTPSAYQQGGYVPPSGSSSTSTTPSYPPYPTTNTPHQMPVPVPNSYGPPTQTGTTATTNNNAGTRDGYGTIQPEHIRTSLLSAVQDKLRARLREAIGTAHAELQSIKKMREDLNGGEQKIKAIMAKLQQDEADLQASMTVYQDAKDEINKLLQIATETEQMSIDDVLDTTAPLYRQLLHSYIEDNAIEDCIYYLSQALKHNKLDLDLFLKNVRMLSREQFRLRAIMIKCRRVAGLDSR